MTSCYTITSRRSVQHRDFSFCELGCGMINSIFHFYKLQLDLDLCDLRGQGIWIRIYLRRGPVFHKGLENGVFMPNQVGSLALTCVFVSTLLA